MSTCNAIRAVQLLLKLTMSAQREVCSRVLSAAKEPYGTDFRNSMAFNNSFRFRAWQDERRHICHLPEAQNGEKPETETGYQCG